MEITDEEIKQILRLIEESNFNEMELEVGEIKLKVIKNGRIKLIGEESKNIPQINKKDNKKIKKEIIKNYKNIDIDINKQQKTSEQLPIGKKGLVPIKSTMIGTFYRRPEPSSPVYVDIGSYVKEDTTVCLLEVMKVFSAVRSGMRGYIREVCAESGDIVEYGQILFWVEPESDDIKEKM